MRVLIIGGSGGIGAAVARELATDGNRLLVHGRDRFKLDKLSEDLKRENAAVETFQHEIDDPIVFLEKLPKDFQPDVLICAFGPIVEGALSESSPADWVRLTLLNLALPGMLVSRFGPGMATRNFGRIVLFGGTSTDQIRGYKTVAVYGAAKTALGVLSKSAAKEWGLRNVTCNVLCPGYVETEYLSEKARGDAKKRMPRGETIAAQEIAHIVKKLVYDLSGTINGAIISCDTGI